VFLEIEHAEGDPMHPTLSTMLADDNTRERLRIADRHRLARAAGAVRTQAPVTDRQPREGARRVLVRWAWLR
jgi:hypothetical protein